MLPSTFGFAFIFVGLLWVVQGFGLISTGSFMDQRRMWGYFGFVMIAIGVALSVRDRRNRRR